MEARGQRSEVGSQESGIREKGKEQGSDVRCQMSGVGDRRTEIGGQIPEARGQMSDVRDQGAKLQGEMVVESPERLYQTAQGLINSEKKEEGIRALKILLESYPDYAVAHNDLGTLYFNNGNRDKAFEHYKKAAELEPNNPVFQKNLADFYYAVLGQVEDSLEHYAMALSSNPADVDTLLMLGHISVSLEKFDEATNFYNDVLKIEPLNKDARQMLDEMVKGQMSEDGDQRTDVGCQMSEDGDQRSDVRCRESEVGGRVDD